MKHKLVQVTVISDSEVNVSVQAKITQVTEKLAGCINYLTKHSRKPDNFCRTAKTSMMSNLPSTPESSFFSLSQRNV